MYFYAKTKSTFRFWKSFRTGIVMKKIWYLEDMKVWATAGEDFKLYLWRISHFTKDEDALISKPLSLHSDEITDCIEVKEPKCFCTSGMDRNIVMFDFE